MMRDGPDTARHRMTRCSLAIFAHNEERGILTCLEHVPAGPGGNDIAVHVLVNGSTDGTAEKARAFAAGRPGVHVHEIAEGGKANAWNLFVHELAGEADFYVFHDGDCWMAPEAIDRLGEALSGPHAPNAAAAYPATGRSAAAWHANRHGVAGNLYALSGRFVRRLRDRSVRMPKGWIGDDDFVDALAQWDADPPGEMRRERVVQCVEAGFGFESLNPLSPADLDLYRKRLIAYSLRRFQDRMLFAAMREDGLAAIPPDVATLYRRELARCRLQWRGSATLFDWIALRRIRRIAAA
ncbi:glycosyltransferase family 2 protein [Iodidimonas sp. SYSU 1G8]|uniref:glycosyltransferase family 2 protein n=1 Tax=Iodidimonas sp. SYSU 1G8 TaxID=3133967 RepID=UPI0031FE9E3B